MAAVHGLTGAMVFALAGASNAAFFKIQGAVDLGGVGGNGGALLGDFHNPLLPGDPDPWHEYGPMMNGQPVSGAGGWNFTPTSFSGVYFFTGGIGSTVGPAGYDGIEIFRGGFGADYSLAGEARVLIRDNGADKSVRFTGIGTPGEAIGGGTLSQTYRLMKYDSGFRSLWVEAIPAPGAVALLAPMGLMAARRRRSSPDSDSSVDGVPFVGPPAGPERRSRSHEPQPSRYEHRVRPA